MNRSPPDASSSSLQSPRRHLAFITGRLAESSLLRVLEETSNEFGFSHEIHVLDVSVAALLTPRLIERRLRLSGHCDEVLVPGYCEGDLDGVAERIGCPVTRGPKDLRDLPRWFRGGRRLEGAAPRADYGEHDLEILAEINHAPKLSTDELVAMAAEYRDDGADIIDLGCIPDTPWSHLGDAVRALRSEGHRVAIDTFDPVEILAGVRAGAELVLSVHGPNLEVTRDLEAEVVAIPDEPGTLKGLDRTLETLRDRGVPHRLDPILEPVGFGFAASLARYFEVRRLYPDTPCLMGVGNLSELTDVDSAGINALLAALCAEIGVTSVLTTQVIPWARHSVRELDIARRLFHHSVKHRTLPKHLDERLVVLGDASVPEYGEETLENLAKSLKDPSFRIFAEGDALHVMNRDGHRRGKEAFELFEQLGVDDPSHAFYLGWELQKAWTALTLGKRYRQDEALDWGHLTREETSHHDRKRRREDPETPAVDAGDDS